MENENKIKEKTPLGNIFYIGLLSFFGGISQDIFIPILPLYLANVLHLDKAFIGLSEGLVTSSASIFKIVSGFLSDKLGSKKSIVFAGYFLSMVSRPILAIITSNPLILLLRFTDGVGKGIKDSPKDALVADSSEDIGRGKAFGIARALDTLGSVIGPLILFALLYFLVNHPYKYQYIFYASAIPLIFTLLIIVFKIKEVEQKKELNKAEGPRTLPFKFYIFLAIVLIFNLGNSSDAFLILRAQNVGASLLSIPLIYALFNFFYAAASIPLGSLSDKIGREKVIILGWFCYALAYLGFALANHTYQIWFIFAFYGIYYATTEGVAKALVADIVPREYRGRAYGIYNSAVGLVTLPASLIAGFLWDHYSSAAPFFFGSAVAMFSTLLLFLFIRFYYPDKLIKNNQP